MMRSSLWQALAVAKLNGMAQKSWPDLAYAGICWHAGQAVRTQIAANVGSIIQDHVKSAIGRNAYALAKLPPGVQSRPAQAVGSAPTLTFEEFELTSPTASLELPMLEGTIERGKRCGKAPESGCALSKFVVSHLRLRGQDETLASDLQADALTGIGRCQVTGVATHEFFVDQDGKVYIKGPCRQCVAWIPLRDAWPLPHRRGSCCFGGGPKCAGLLQAYRP